MSERCAVCSESFPFAQTVHMLIHTQSEGGVLDLSVCKPCYTNEFAPLLQENSDDVPEGTSGGKLDEVTRGDEYRYCCILDTGLTSPVADVRSSSIRYPTGRQTRNENNAILRRLSGLQPYVKIGTWTK